MKELDGKVALITGGGSGIGAGIATAFVAAGARVTITDLDEAAARAVADQVGGNCHPVKGDHRDGADNQRAVAATLDAWGKLDILFNNAGTATRNPIEQTSDEAIERLLSVNVAGPYRMTQAALPALRQRASEGAMPVILFTASIQSLMVKPNFTLYGASKHALAGLVRSLALELAPEGIRVNGICPGPVDTPLLRAGLARPGLDMEKALADYARDIPMRRLTPVGDVAELAVFLCSDRARSMTGVLVPVDGGITAA